MIKGRTLILISVGLIIVIGGFWFWENEQEVIREEKVQNVNNQKLRNNNELVWYEVQELGIKFKLESEIPDDLIYFYESERPIKWGNKKGMTSTAYFTSSKLKMLNNNCSAEFGPLGAISKIEGRSTDYTVNSKGYFEEREVKQFDDFFVYFSGPQAICLNDSEEWNNFFDENPELKGIIGDNFHTIERK